MTDLRRKISESLWTRTYMKGKKSESEDKRLTVSVSVNDLSSHYFHLFNQEEVEKKG